ncbi:MAG: hypothetical protein ACK4OP_00155 [Gemmobacter sp.]
MTDLYALTRDLHHAAEAHPFMRRMAAARIAPQDWADWLGAMRLLHEAVDPSMPPVVQRGWPLLHDLIALDPIRPRAVPAAAAFARALAAPADIAGAAYILIGAHFRGGAVMRKRLEPAGLPCAHLRFADPADVNAFVIALRSMPQLAPGARACFAAITAIADQIEERAR